MRARVTARPIRPRRRPLDLIDGENLCMSPTLARLLAAVAFTGILVAGCSTASPSSAPSRHPHAAAAPSSSPAGTATQPAAQSTKPAAKPHKPHEHARKPHKHKAASQPAPSSQPAAAPPSSPPAAQPPNPIPQGNGGDQDADN